MCWVGIILEEKKKNEKAFTRQYKKTPQVGIQVKQEKKYLYSGTGYPAALMLNCVCANDDMYEGKNTASDHVRILSSCWGVRVLLV